MAAFFMFLNYLYIVFFMKNFWFYAGNALYLYM